MPPAPSRSRSTKVAGRHRPPMRAAQPRSAQARQIQDTGESITGALFRCSKRRHEVSPDLNHSRATGCRDQVKNKRKGRVLSDDKGMEAAMKIAIWLAASGVLALATPARAEPPDCAL